MTILLSLVSHYDRIISRKDTGILLPEYGYSSEKISFCVILSAQGEIMNIQDYRVSGDGSRPKSRPRPQELTVPRSFLRPGRAPKAFYLWDKTAYVFGVRKNRNSDKSQLTYASEEHDAFVNLHREAIGDTDDEGLQALLTFLERWNVSTYSSLSYAQDMLDTNVVFKLDGDDRLLHERDAAKDSWEGYMSHNENEKRLCLVTGKYAPIERVHPAIKGVWGAQASGASIVSFNLSAFESYEKKTRG